MKKTQMKKDLSEAIIFAIVIIAFILMGSGVLTLVDLLGLSEVFGLS